MAKLKRKKRDETYQTEGFFKALSQSASRSEYFVERYQNALMALFGLLILGIVGYYAYQNLYLKPREKEANDALFYALKYLRQDSLNYALKGDGQNYGFVDIIQRYSDTPAGNLAEFYAGSAYLRKGEYQKAIARFDAFSSQDEIVAAQAQGAIGDAFMELEQFKDAEAYYEKAAHMRKNAFTTPLYLEKAAMASIAQQDWKSVETYFEEIKRDYPKSAQAAKADAFIARARAAQKR